MSHLTLDQRYAIEFGLNKQRTYKEIGDRIGKDKSVISREVRRNSDKRDSKYRAELANRKAQVRLIKKPKKRYWTAEIEALVIDKIRNGNSPEQIVGRSRLEGKKCVSHERIYQYIWENKKQGGCYYKHLRRRGRRYRKRSNSHDNRGLLRNRIDIDQRPSVVEQKSRIGDLEIDLVIGKGHKQALLTINDRATGMLFMDKVLTKEAQEIEKKTLSLLSSWSPLIHTITSDNGKEFANHERIAEELSIDFYFAKPYHSWQRGANENLNGLVRQYFKKDADFTKISAQQIKEVQTILNNRPRKRFGFKTPNEVFAEKLDNSQPVTFVT